MAPNTAKKIDLFGKNKPAEVTQEQEVNSLVAKAKQLIINTVEQANAVTVFINNCKATVKKIKEHHAPMKSKAHEAWKATVAAEKALLEPLEEAIIIANKTQSIFFENQERIKKEAEAKAEKDRAEKAAQLRIEAETMITEIVQSDSPQEEKIQSLVAQLEQGDCSEEKAVVIRAAISGLEAGAESQNLTETIQEEIDVEVSITSTPVVYEETKVKGVVKKYKYSAEIVDMVALCKAIGEGKVPPGVVKVAQGPLNAHAKALQGRDIPGCKVNKQLSTHTRG